MDTLYFSMCPEVWSQGALASPCSGRGASITSSFCSNWLLELLKYVVLVSNFSNSMPVMLCMKLFYVSDKRLFFTGRRRAISFSSLRIDDFARFEIISLFHVRRWSTYFLNYIRLTNYPMYMYLTSKYTCRYPYP